MNLRRRKWLWIALIALLVVFAANHAEWWLRQRRTREPAASVSVRAETGPSPAHRTIGIDEGAAPARDSLFLRFAMLGQWAFDAKSPSPCPAELRALSGREASCIGFMYPLEAGTKIRSFCLLRTTQTCCYGPRPQFNQYLLVEMKQPVKFERLTPVIVRGKFFPDAQSEQGFIYRMDGESVTPIEGDAPEEDPAAIARDAGLPLFDFAPLRAMEGDNSGVLPPALLALDGKPALVAGFLLNRAEGDAPRLLVGFEYWDGVSRGRPPTLYNAVMVFPAHASEMPPIWKERSAFAGVLRVERDPSRWAQTGIVSLREASRRPAGSSSDAGDGPRLRPMHELLILGVVLAFGLIGKHREAARS